MYCEQCLVFSQRVQLCVQHPVIVRAVVWQHINPERCWMDSWLDPGLACLPLPQVANPPNNVNSSNNNNNNDAFQLMMS